MTPVEISGKLCAHMWARTVPKDCISTSFSYQSHVSEKYHVIDQKIAHISIKNSAGTYICESLLSSVSDRHSSHFAVNLWLCLKAAFQQTLVAWKVCLCFLLFLQLRTQIWKNVWVGKRQFLKWPKWFRLHFEFSFCCILALEDSLWPSP